MRLKSTVAVIWILLVNALWGQFDLLTPREASRIVEQIPEVVEAAKRLPCSLLPDVIIPDPHDLTILNVEVRAGCLTSTGSSLIDRYVVNRRTGVVTTWGDHPAKVGDQASEAFAQQLVMQARARVLSVAESRCLALEAARNLPGWDDSDGSTRIGPMGAPPFSPETLFWLSHESPQPPTKMRSVLYVDPSTGHVRDEGSAEEIASSSLGKLLARLIVLRFPPVLSDHDALSIAVRLPTLAKVLQRKGCSLVAGIAFTPEVAQIQPACEGRLESGGVAVNLRDGTVTDADTGKAIDAEDLRVFAGSLVSALRETRLRLQNEVDTQCRSIEPR